MTPSRRPSVRMSSARDSLVRRLLLISVTLTEPLLIDRSPTDVAHNERAGILRAGLMVSMYTGFEDFIRRRSAELLSEIAATSVTFSDLPTPLKLRATVEAVSGMSFRARIARKDGGDPMMIIQQASADIASTAQARFVLSEYGWGHASSNVGEDELEKMMASFQLATIWDDISEIKSKVGLGSLPARSDFRNAARLRHLAAHEPTPAIQPSDLLSAHGQILGISLAMDIVMSRAAFLMRRGDVEILAKKLSLAGRVRFLFLLPTARGVATKRDGARRASRVHRTAAEAWAAVQVRLLRGKEVAVELNAVGVPVNWWTPDCP